LIEGSMEAHEWDIAEHMKIFGSIGKAGNDS